MFAVRINIDFPFARSSSLSRPASLDLGLFTNPSEIRLFTSSSSRPDGGTNHVGETGITHFTSPFSQWSLTGCRAFHHIPADGKNCRWGCKNLPESDRERLVLSLDYKPCFFSFGMIVIRKRSDVNGCVCIENNLNWCNRIGYSFFARSLLMSIQRQSSWFAT